MWTKMNATRVTQDFETDAKQRAAKTLTPMIKERGGVGQNEMENVVHGFGAVFHHYSRRWRWKSAAKDAVRILGLIRKFAGLYAGIVGLVGGIYFSLWRCRRIINSVRSGSVGNKT